jgi:hypothetical protein
MESEQTKTNQKQREWMGAIGVVMGLTGFMLLMWFDPRVALGWLLCLWGTDILKRSQQQ